ncbi:Catenin alpha-2 [Strongyloides ratti]|uniref:Catenin alpha-2 n=1 Tax=Strongyloides ratti TaxID=34506 RepID=A0A090MXC8_STRRB|nr:Catenin alpha-2 [Strongyloides ratti]CEF65209.1 Catenin alpha-2 [Strongyloides ratti]
MVSLNQELKDQLKVIKTKSVEKILSPLIDELILLTQGSDANRPRTNKSGATLLANLQTELQNFLSKAEYVLSNYSIERNDEIQQLGDLIEEINENGRQMVVRGSEFVNDTGHPVKRATANEAAKDLLISIIRLLIVADHVDVQKIIEKIKKAKESLDSLDNCKDVHEVLDRYSKFCGEIEEVTSITKKRIKDLKNPNDIIDLQAIFSSLCMNKHPLLTTTKTYLKNPQSDKAKELKNNIYNEIRKNLKHIEDILDDKGEWNPNNGGMSHLGYIDKLIQELDNFQHNIYMEPYSFREHLHRPLFEEQVEKIVDMCAEIADSEYTREEKKNKITIGCNELRFALQELIGEYINCGSKSESTVDLDLAMVYLGRKIRDLRRHLRRAAVDYASDVLLDTQSPLIRLVEAAASGNRNDTVKEAKNFKEYINEVIKVSELCSKMSNNIEGIRNVRFCTFQIKRLSPEVINAAFLLCDNPNSKEIQENMDIFKNLWLNKMDLLTMAIDSLMSVDDFLAVSEARIDDNFKSTIEGIVASNVYTLHKATNDIRGRSLRVCDVVEAEMALIPPTEYSEAVKKASKILRDNVLPQFTDHSKEITQRILDHQENGYEIDKNSMIDEMIDACGLLHNAVKNVRHALLMNRNPEDIDSDIEYEEDGMTTTIPDTRSQVSDGDNQQRVMRHLPEEDKKKIQEQIDVFKLAQRKFEHEVGKWDETGNDIIALAKHMCMIMMNMTDFTRGRGPYKKTSDVIKAAQEISDAGNKLNALARQIGNECVESETKKDLFAYLQRIILYCQQLNITSRVKAEVQEIGNELKVSGLDSAMSLIQTAKNLLNAVVLTVKAAYIASTKYRSKENKSRSIVEWTVAPPKKVKIIRNHDKPRNGVIRRASERREINPLKALQEFSVN